MNALRLLRALLPLAVTAAVFVLISQRVAWTDVLAHLRPDSLRLLVPALVVYAASCLVIDTLSLMRASEAGDLSPGRWARLRAASYPVGLLHYALGAAALVYLLRRRAGLTLSDATGTVMMIAALDLLALLAITALAAAFASDGVGLRVGVLTLGLLGAPFGLWLLRTGRSLGPLEAVRGLGVLRAARHLPTARLLQLFALRALFIVVFISLGGVALASFGLRPHPAVVVVGFAQVALVAALPIAVAGLGTSQAAFLYVFRSLAPPDELLACSVALSAGMIAVRIGLGVLFVTEFSSPARSAERSGA